MSGVPRELCKKSRCVFDKGVCCIFSLVAQGGSVCVGGVYTIGLSSQDQHGLMFLYYELEGSISVIIELDSNNVIINI